MIYWAPLLHFYQPPTQHHWVLKKVCEESYRPLIKLFRELPNAKITVNINGVLTEMLDEHGMSDVLDGLRELGERGQLEFTGSAKYHPILPLIPQDEILRQIMHNYNTNRRLLGKSYAPAGFFPPELAYSGDILRQVVDSGYCWILLSGVACPVAWPMDVIHQVSHDGQRMAVFFRDDILSNRISFRAIDAQGFIKHLEGLKEGDSDRYVVTAMDAETFGHHIQHWEKYFLAEVYEALEHNKQPKIKPRKGALNEVPNHLEQSATVAQEHGTLFRSQQVAGGEIQVVTISKLFEIFQKGQNIEPRASSWSTSLDDIKANNPYPLWKDPNNQIHQLLWRHLKIALEITRKAQDVAVDQNSKHFSDIARALLDSALHSCQFWWASKRPNWDVNMVSLGLVEQREVIFNAYMAISVSNLPEDIRTEYFYHWVVASRDIRNRITDLLYAS
jgi:alpha-amylase/alpha-mannosidase (GH57 family)